MAPDRSRAIAGAAAPALDIAALRSSLFAMLSPAFDLRRAPVRAVTPGAVTRLG
jgi:hypothetical protein